MSNYKGRLLSTVTMLGDHVSAAAYTEICTALFGDENYTVPEDTEYVPCNTYMHIGLCCYVF